MFCRSLIPVSYTHLDVYKRQALVNQQVTSGGKSSLGFLNPVIYSIGQSPSYNNDFHDITSGTNNNGQGQSFNAVVGYDLVTGWGSPNGQSLIDELSGSTMSASRP